MRNEISVLMSVFNGEALLAPTLDSVLSQSYDYLEFIIVDDASTDNTSRILQQYIQRDKRIIVLKNEKNIGLTKSLNIGLKQAKGSFIARIDCGDNWIKEKIERQVKYIQNYPDIVLLGCQAYVSDKKRNKTWRSNLPAKDIDIRHALLNGINPFIHSSVIFRRGNLYDERFYRSQDHELWSRLSFQGKLGNLEECLVLYNVDFFSMSFKNRAEQIYLKKVIYQNYISRINNSKDANLSIPRDKGYFVRSSRLFGRIYSFAFAKSNNVLVRKMIIMCGLILCPRVLATLITYKIETKIGALRYKSKITAY